jgi:hypothetical protein
VVTDGNGPPSKKLGVRRAPRRKSATSICCKRCYTLDVHYLARVNDREGIYRVIAACIGECISYISIHSCGRHTCSLATGRSRPGVVAGQLKGRRLGLARVTRGSGRRDDSGPAHQIVILAIWCGQTRLTYAAPNRYCAAPIWVFSQSNEREGFMP